MTFLQSYVFFAKNHLNGEKNGFVAGTTSDFALNDVKQASKSSKYKKLMMPE